MLILPALNLWPWKDYLTVEKTNETAYGKHNLEVWWIPKKITTVLIALRFEISTKKRITNCIIKTITSSGVTVMNNRVHFCLLRPLTSSYKNVPFVQWFGVFTFFLPRICILAFKWPWQFLMIPNSIFAVLTYNFPEITF